MLGKINPKQLDKMMKQMGMKTENIDAREVIIKTKDKEIIIENPVVQKVNVMGQDSIQIQGNIIERELKEYNEDDIKLVMEQADIDREKAEELLNKTNGDIAEAILLASKE